MLQDIGIAGGTGEDTAYLKRYFEPLVTIARTRCNLSLEVAESLAHDVLLSSLVHQPTVADLSAWLYGAITTAARLHLEKVAAHDR